MQIRVGFEMIYDCPQPTPMIFNAERALHAGVRSRRARRPAVRSAGPDRGLSRQLRQLVHAHRRAQGAHAHLRRRDRQRLRRAGRRRSRCAAARRCRTCPKKRCCSCSAAATAKPIGLSEIAWNLFGQAPTGWGRVQAICDFVHRHITFGYEHARMTRTALRGRTTTRPASAATTRTSPSPSAAA